MKKALLIACVLGLGGGSVAFAHGGFHGGPFNRADANGDGKVTLAELQKMASDRFAQVDANKDSRVTKQELDSFGAQLGSKHEGERGERMQHRLQRVGEEFTRADANHDGAVDAKELQSAVAQRFATLDENKDGALAREEMFHGFRGGDCGHGRHGFGEGGHEHAHENPGAGSAGSGAQK